LRHSGGNNEEDGVILMIRLEVVDENCGSSEQAGLYDVCEWFVQNYPEDIFTGYGEDSTEGSRMVCAMRDLSKKILAMRKK